MTRAPVAWLLALLLVGGCPTWDGDPTDDDSADDDDASGDDDSAGDDDATDDDDATADDDDVTADDDDATADDDDATADDDDSTGDDDTTGDDDDSTPGYTAQLLSQAAAKFSGEAAEDHAGVSVASAGDVNDDGRSDLLIGADGHDVIDGDEGAAYLFYGPVAGDHSLAAANAKLTGEAGGDRAGSAVSSAGDVDNDGHDDLLIGAYRESSVLEHEGAAYLVYGPVAGVQSLASADAKWIGESDHDWAGSAVCGGGDVDGDGYGDIAVGAYHESSVATESGAVYLLEGPLTGSHSLSVADAKITGEAAYDWAGTSIACAGDTNGDGRADLLIGASGAGGFAGAVYLVRGPVIGSMSLASADAKLTGEMMGDYAGVSVAFAGDVDGDGLDDVIAGATYNDGGAGNSGSAYLFLSPFVGIHGLATADTKVLGEGPDDFAGVSVGSAGDVDGDGLDDLLIGASNEDGLGYIGGAAYVVVAPPAGPHSLFDADVKLIGEADNDWAGRPAAPAGDVDGDGRGDVLIAAPREDSGGADAGAAYLFYATGL